MSGGHGSGAKQCGLTELLVFIAAIISGTGSSITSKVLLDLKSEGLTGEVEKFSFPLFQTFGMFAGMTVALIMHYIVSTFHIPFPGYKHPTKKITTSDNKSLSNTESQSLVNKNNNSNDDEEEAEVLPMWMYFFLIIPSVFDLIATTLCMFGLRYVNVSIYQMLRGSGIVFVAILKQTILKHTLKKFMWVGVFWNVVSVFLVGGAAMLAASQSTDSDSESSPLAGVILICCGAFVQSLQFVFEEKVMTEMEIPAPPLLLIGMEGLWGSIICLFVLYPIAYITPGDDHGCYENPFNTIEMLKNSFTIQWVFFVYFFSVFLYNFFAILVTLMMNSVWHAILDNFRPMTVWGVDMYIYYAITMSLGEPWTPYSFVQLVGMVVLLYGTAIYNAPNAGSILLKGEWYSFGLDLTKEYDEIQDEMETQQLDQPSAMPSPYMATMSPFMVTPGGTHRTPGGRVKPPKRYEAVPADEYSAVQLTRRDRGGSFA
jgi:drug/metabolite transporter (DMT)-like permease